MRTLIVEDSATLCSIYEAYLDGTGLDVYTVGSYRDAVKSVESLLPDLILLDIELPDGNGLDLLANTTKMATPPIVVVMTGHGMELAEAAIQRGADDFLGKPFDAARLRVTLTNAARKSELTRRVESLGTNEGDQTSGAGESTPAHSDAQDDVPSPIRPLWVVEREAIEAAIRH